MAKTVDFIEVVSVFRSVNCKEISVVCDNIVERYATDSFAFPKMKEAAKMFIRAHRKDLVNVKFSIERVGTTIHFSTWLSGRNSERKRCIL